MIKKIAWDAFKNTGDINTFLEYKKIDNIEKEIVEAKIRNEESYFDLEDEERS